MPPAPLRPIDPPRGRRLATGLALASALLAGIAVAAPTPGTGPVYTVVRGDTLIGIARRLLDDPARWRELRRLNRIADPRRVPVGTALRIEPSWLRGEPAVLTVGQVGGGASVDDAPVVAGATVTEGSRFRTAEDGVVVVLLRDGTVMTIPPASTVRIERLRQYLGTESIEARIDIERGAIETRSAPARQRGLQIRTPAATAAVRGTEFRVRTRGDETAIEVLTGAVDSMGPAGAARILAGQAVVATVGGAPRVESLLDAPSADGLPPVVTTPSATLRFSRVAGAHGYAIQVARDDAFLQLIAEQRGEAPEITVSPREDGRLHVRARAVSASGAEGRETRASVEVAARPEPPFQLRPPERSVIFERVFAFGWAEPHGASSYRVQVAADPSFARPILDTVTPGVGASVELPALAGGATATWWWRIASIASTPGGPRQGPFSPPRAVEHRAVGGAPAGLVDGDSIELSWPPLAGHRYQLQLAGSAEFVGPLLQRDVDAPRATIGGLDPGTYWARTRSIDPRGIVSPYGPPQRIVVGALLRSGSGDAVRSGAGTPVELQHPR